ncbi:MAG: tetratricopeptide repeat protein [Candidatus Competibacteraceae bacterium]
MSRTALVLAGSLALAGCASLSSGPTVTDATAVDSLVGEGAALLTSPPPSPSSSPQPPTPAFVGERAQHAYATGRWDVAEGYYLQLTRLRPRDATPWFQLGNLYAEQGRLLMAERAYREALRRRDEARTLHNLGLVQVRLGVGALREARERLPADDPVHEETRELLRALLDALAR